MRSISLSPIKKLQKPLSFAVCDIETAKWTNFLCIGYKKQEHFKVFTKLADFFEEVFQGPDVVFAHYGGRFDFLFLLEYAIEHLKVSDMIPSGSSIRTFRITKNDKTITFYDSAAILPFSLKNLAENFEVDHQKLEIDYTKITTVTPELIKYLEHDCLALFEILNKYYSQYLIKKAGPAFTSASQALRIFRTYLAEPMLAPPKCVQNFARLSYMGGRTEIFRPFSEKKIYCYDVNSLYPSAMLEDMPMGRALGVFDFDENHLGIYKAQVVSPENLFVPVLGILKDNKYIFPLGRFEGVWTNVELIYARSLGYKFEIMDGYVFPAKQKLFHDYVTDLYALRLKSKSEVDKIIYKRALNCLYGRFGLNPNKKTLDLGENNKNASVKHIFKSKSKNYGLWENPISLGSYYDVAIASFVTSYARIHLHKLLNKYQKNLYYTDTDSLWLDKKPDAIDCDQSKLGKLKLEGEWDSAVFLLPKTYFAKGPHPKIAMKGFEHKKLGHLTLDDFKSALEGDLSSLKTTNEPRFATFKTALRQNKLVAMSNPKSLTRQIKSKYTKRTICRIDDKYTTEPLRLEGDKK